MLVIFDGEKTSLSLCIIYIYVILYTLYVIHKFVNILYTDVLGLGNDPKSCLNSKS
jgi:hypothetical protein